jgi:hypothetical protein
LSGQLYVGSYNATTGDRILNDYHQGVAGGASSSVAATVGYNCLIGTQAAPHGAVGTLVQNYGCFVPGSTTTCYTDCVVVDVTNL